MLSVALRVGFVCPECMGPVPMNGIAKGVLCHTCQSIVSTEEPLGWLRQLLESIWGHPRTWSSKDAQTNVTIQAIRSEGALRPPACHGCNAAFDESSLAAAFQTGTGVTCRGCSEVASARMADDLVRWVLPGAQAVVGEVIGTALKAAPQPILFSCLQCGAGLPVDGSKRVIACTYCKATSFLPDALWLRMHPAAKRLWFYLAAA